MHSDFFKVIGGFDPTYETGEDEKLCGDAKKHGGEIIKNNSIHTIHHGYPKTIKQFFKRELWHGKTLIHNLKYPWKDRSLLFALYNVLIVFIFILLIRKVNFVLLICLTSYLMLLPLFIFSKISLGKNNKKVVKLTILLFVYGIAKTVALLKSIYKIFCINKS